MRAGLVVICHVREQYVPEVTLAEHNDVIEYLPPDRANQPFSIGVLPGRPRCNAGGGSMLPPGSITEEQYVEVGRVERRSKTLSICGRSRGTSKANLRGAPW